MHKQARRNGKTEKQIQDWCIVPFSEFGPDVTSKARYIFQTFTESVFV